MVNNATTGGDAGSNQEETQRKSERLINKKILEDAKKILLDKEATPRILLPRKVEISTQMDATEIQEVRCIENSNGVSRLNYYPNNYAYPPLPFNIPEFGGNKSEQVDDWLVSLETIGQQHEWPENVIFKQAVTRLYGSALRWYEIHKTTILTWENFKVAINRDFGENDRTEFLISRLNKKMQGNETSLRFVEEILHLCQQINVNMSLEEKIDHVIMGLNETLAFAILMKPVSSIGELLETCRKYDLFKEKRKIRKNNQNMQWENKNYYFNRNSDINRNNWNTNVQPRTNMWNVNANPKKFVNNWNSRDQHNNNNNWMARTRPPPTSPQTWKRNPPPHSPPPRQTNYRDTPHVQPRRADEMRTKDNKPICFSCNRPGHISKYCRQKQIRAINYEDHIDPTINDQQPHNYYKNRSNQDFEEVQSNTYADICRPTSMLQNQRPTCPIPTSNRYAELEYEHNLN